MYQKIVLAGNLGRDPEMRYTPRGVPITNFPLATSRKWADPEGQIKEETTWWRISVYGKQGEACNQYLSKGRKVLVEGVMVIDEKTGGPRVYTRKDGTAGASFELRASTVRFLSPRDTTDGNGSVNAGAPTEPEGMTEEELPF